MLLDLFVQLLILYDFYLSRESICFALVVSCTCNSVIVLEIQKQSLKKEIFFFFKWGREGTPGE